MPPKLATAQLSTVPRQCVSKMAAEDHTSVPKKKNYYFFMSIIIIRLIFNNKLTETQFT